MSKNKIVIIGGVAGGASCAARCRRLDESAKIIVIDRGPYVSFANCGLPYYVGDVIKEESKLLVADAALFQERFNIEVRTKNEALAIDRATQEIEVKEISDAAGFIGNAMMLSCSRLAPQLCGPLCRAWMLRESLSCVQFPTAGRFGPGSARRTRKTQSSLARVLSGWKWQRTSRIEVFP